MRIITGMIPQVVTEPEYDEMIFDTYFSKRVLTKTVCEIFLSPRQKFIIELYGDDTLHVEEKTVDYVVNVGSLAFDEEGLKAELESRGDFPPEAVMEKEVYPNEGALFEVTKFTYKWYEITTKEELV